VSPFSPEISASANRWRFAISSTDSFVHFVTCSTDFHSGFLPSCFGLVWFRQRRYFQRDNGPWDETGGYETDATQEDESDAGYERSFPAAPVKVLVEQVFPLIHSCLSLCTIQKKTPARMRGVFLLISYSYFRVDIIKPFGI
jgi:hypothetical protein